MFNRLKRFLGAFVVAGAALASQPAHAGIPVIDVANLAQAIQQVLAWAQQYEQMTQQIQQYEQEYNSLTGIRGFGDILNNPMLQQAVPADVATVYNGINSGGYGGLTSAAKALRDAAMKYNCEDRTGEDRTTCQAILNANSQTQAYQQNALNLMTQRVSQIQQLQNQIDATTDPKAIAELQARIQAENTQVSNDANRIALMDSMAKAEQDAADQANRERWLKLLKSDTPNSADSFEYVPPM